jgi:hypothetical protein
MFSLVHIYVIARTKCYLGVVVILIAYVKFT